MADIELRARIFDEKGEPLGGFRLRIEAYVLGKRAWVQVRDTSTDMGGFVRVLMQTSDDLRNPTVPLFRLTEISDGTRVLSGTYDFVEGQNDLPDVDFGEIQLMRDAQVIRAGFDGKPSHLLGGAIRRWTGGRGDDGRPATTLVPYGDDGPVDSRTDAELAALHKQNVEKSLIIQDRDRELATKDHALSLAATETSELEASLAAARTRADTAEAELARIKTPSKGTESDIATVFTNIGTKLSSTHQTLKAQENPFRIGQIKVDLKGDVDSDGKIFLGGDKETASGVSVEMSPEGDAKADGVTVVVPEVVGLTQAAARRVLRSIGLRLTTANQTVAAGVAAHGQALRQTPAAGQSIQHGSEVLVVFAVVPEAEE